MNLGEKTRQKKSFGEILLCGEREHGQYPLQKKLRCFPHDFILLYLFEGGGTYLDAYQTSFELSAGSCLIIPPETPHIYHPHNPADWSEIFYVFRGAVFSVWQSQGLLPSTTYHYVLEPTDYWLQKFRTALSDAHFGSDSLGNCCLLQLIFADIHSWIEKDRFLEEDLLWLEKAKRLMDAGIGTNASLVETAAQLGVSYDHFRKRFKMIGGLSPSAYRTQVQINRASKLLLETLVPISEIAETLGFCDIFHFSKRFKQVTGLSPLQYRKRI